MAASTISSDAPKTGSLWNSLTAPAEQLSTGDRQRARLLASTTLVFFPVAVFTLFSTPIRDLIVTGTFTPPAPATLLALGLILLSYILSRTENFFWGAVLVIATPIFAVVGQILGTVGPVTTPAAYYFLALSITLASLLLSARETVIAGAAVILTMLWLSPMKSPTGEVELVAISFALVITVTSSIVSAIRDQNMAALEASQRNLQQQVVETTAAREQAERSDRVKSAFLASMSHELRTPLNAIINFTRYVAKGSMGPVNDEQKETLDEVVDSAKHLLNLINDVLDMSKIEAGSLVLFVEENIDVTAIVDSVATTGKSLILDKPVEIKVNVAPDLPAIRADRQRITQILLNIMSNACKFTEAGSIDIDVQRTGSSITFTIRDTGTGIRAEDQADVFQPFKQTTTGLRQGGGTGLGMPISRSLAEAHGGRMWLESELSRGSTFYVEIPIKSEVLQPAAAA